VTRTRNVDNPADLIMRSLERPRRTGQRDLSRAPRGGADPRRVLRRRLALSHPGAPRAMREALLRDGFNMVVGPSGVTIARTE
jgi:hypothetical protein